MAQDKPVEILEVWTDPKTGERTITYTDGTQSKEPSIESTKRKSASNEGGNGSEGKSEHKSEAPKA